MTELFALPCRTMLQRYLGATPGEIGFSQLVKQRLNAEMECLGTGQAKLYSLVVDEIRIKQRLEYNKQRDVFLGDVDDMGALNNVLSDLERSELANLLLCFLICVALTLCSESQWYTSLQPALVNYSLKLPSTSSEQLEFKIVRAVTDNHKINVAAVKVLSCGKSKTRVSYPSDPSRSLFLAFDQSHPIENIRSQFLA